MPAHYLGFFVCFNDQLFYEAHDVLEELWLADRHGPNGDFFKGLIQLAGAFVHLQKERLRPAAALFKLSRTNLLKYPATHERLDVAAVLQLIEVWLGGLEGDAFKVNPLRTRAAPGLRICRLLEVTSTGAGNRARATANLEAASGSELLRMRVHVLERPSETRRSIMRLDNGGSCATMASVFSSSKRHQWSIPSFG